MIRRLLFLTVLLTLPLLATEDNERPLDPIRLKYRQRQQGVDNRIALHSKDFPFSAIGKVITGTGTCTGEMVDRYWAITNAHCVCDKNKEPCSPDELVEEIAFHPNYADGFSVFYSKWDRIWWGTPGTETDIALIRLKSPIGDRTGSFTMATRSLDTLTSDAWKDRLFMAGYPRDSKGGQVPTLYLACSILGPLLDNLGWGHDCSNAKGASGSALAFMKNETIDGYYIVALNWGSGNGPDSGAAAPLSAVWDEMIAYKRRNTEQRKTTFHACNFSGKGRIFFAYAYFDDAHRYWRSTGHYELKDGRCKEFVFPSKKANGSKLYVYAENKGFTWPAQGGTGYRMCYSDDPFEYRDANSCKDENNSKVFEQFEVNHNQMNVIEF